VNTKASRYKSVRGVCNWLNGPSGSLGALFHGSSEDLLNGMPRNSVDLIVTSPPYCMGKEYEHKDHDLQTFIESHKKLLPLAINALKDGGSLCWQVGFHVQSGVCTPLDFLVFQAMQAFPQMKLRNRIVWTFGHGLHCANRFSGRHETILWFTKGDHYDFDLDAVRVAQKYPGKRYSVGPKKGLPSGNPAGKNPTDVWDIPNVKAKHVEKTDHPCQFPVGIVQRLVRALTKPGDLVFDPFSGVASAGVGAVVEGRRYLGAEIDESYVDIAERRLTMALQGKLDYRPADRAIHVPNPNDQVVRRPPGFASAMETNIRALKTANPKHQPITLVTIKKKRVMPGHRTS